MGSSKKFAINRANFRRIAREITDKVSDVKPSYRWQAEGLGALQAAAETFLVAIFEDIEILALHAKKSSLFSNTKE